jgi:hypothetical protein
MSAPFFTLFYSLTFCITATCPTVAMLVTAITQTIKDYGKYRHISNTLNNGYSRYFTTPNDKIIFFNEVLSSS